MSQFLSRNRANSPLFKWDSFKAEYEQGEARHQRQLDRNCRILKLSFQRATKCIYLNILYEGE